MRLVAPLVLLLLTAGCRTALPDLGPAPSAVDALAAWYAEKGDTNCVIALASGASHGDVHAVYRVASVSKLFMLLAADRLAAEGRVDLDAPIGDYRAFGLPREFASVTLRELLEHRSGLPREFLRADSPCDLLWAVSCGLFDCDFYRGAETDEEILKAINEPYWRHDVRVRKRCYSNVGFGLAWRIIDTRLGTDYREIFDAYVRRPLGLDDSGFDPDSRAEPLESGDIPWLLPRGTPIPPHRLTDWYTPCGDLWSSAADCQKLARAYWPLIDRELANRDTATLEDGDLVAGLSVHHLPDGTLILYRSGMIYGGASFIGFDTSTREVAVILRNRTCWPGVGGFALMSALHKDGNRKL